MINTALKHLPIFMMGAVFILAATQFYIQQLIISDKTVVIILHPYLCTAMVKLCIYLSSTCVTTFTSGNFTLLHCHIKYIYSIHKALMC